MKFYEYGVRTSESEGFVGVFDSGKHWEALMHEFTILGLQGWENYEILEKNNVVHFFFRREITKEEAKDTYFKKEREGVDTYPLGFVDHPKPNPPLG